MMVASVVVHGVGDGEAAHEVGEGRRLFDLLEHKVKMIGHKAIG